MKKTLVRGLSLALLSLISLELHAEDKAPTAQERTAVDSALKRDVTHVNLTAAPVTHDTAPARAGGGPVEAKSSSLHAIGGATKAQTNDAAGDSRALDAPQVGEASALRPTARQRSRRGAPRAEDPQRAIIDGMNASFAACLTAADAAVEGAAVLNVAIAPTGAVANVATVTPGGVSPKAATCFRDAITKAKFAPGTDASVVQVRIVPRDLRTVTSR